MPTSDLTPYQKAIFEGIKKKVEKFLDPVPMLASDEVLAAFCADITPPERSLMGGRFTYEFCPTGIGTGVVVKDLYTGNEVDLSGTENW